MKIKNIYFIFLLIMGISVPVLLGKNIQKRGVMDNVNDGLKMAGQMFGINTAADVANLVAKAFSSTASNFNTQRRKPDIFTTILQQVLKDPKPSKSKEETKETEKSENSEEFESNGKQFHSNSPPPPTSASDGNDNFGLNFNAATIVTTMLRMVGFDATKLGALAINALIMIASAIGNTILSTTRPTSANNNRSPEPQPESEESGPEQRYSPTDYEPRQLKEGSPLDWFLQNPSPTMKNLLNDAISSNLSDKITEMIANREREEGQGACLKMLVCKSSPFIWGMQKAVSKRINGNGDDADNADKKLKEEDRAANDLKSKKLFNIDMFYNHFPSLDEYREHGEKCEKLYLKYCNVTNVEGPHSNGSS